MKAVSSVLLVLVLVPLSACAPKVNDPADVQAVKQTVETYAKGILAKDAPACAAMMTDKTAFFEPHSSTLGGDDIKVLGMMADIVKGDPSFKMRVVGFTDPVEEDKDDKELAKARAETVRNYLVGSGILGDRIDVKSKGDEESFGQAFIPSYDFSKADVIVSVAADFLCTWLSPVEFTKQYAKARRKTSRPGKQRACGREDLFKKFPLLRRKRLRAYRPRTTPPRRLHSFAAS